MADSALQSFLDAARVDADVFALRPDYRVLLVAVDGLAIGPSDASDDELLAAAEASARADVAQTGADGVPHVAAWREAFRAFGANPRRTRNSLEALLRRAASDGLPRINRLTDVYNALSVLHRIPFGGEDLHAYAGSPHLTIAAGTEPFDTVADGAPIVDHPASGEVVWRDDAGITCRAWNWRQCRRTALTPETTSAVFILDALAPASDADLRAAADDLVSRLSSFSPGLTSARRLIAARDASA